uniref:Uncharacterized protein n=1 Tax=Arundo donax TaxID=35708 RepID=A0A0A9F067_ARUDO
MKRRTTALKSRSHPTDRAPPSPSLPPSFLPRV